MLQGYTTIRFEGKGIQVKWDTKPKKYWFVVVDVLAYFFDNPHNFWKQIKKTIETNGEPTSNYYLACTYDNETIDIADYKQIVNLLQYIPGRANKKERLVTWLIYPMPSAIQNEVYNLLFNKNQNKNFDKIIAKANYCDVPTETVKGYIEYLSNKKQIQQYIAANESQPSPKKENINTKKEDITTNEEKKPTEKETLIGCLVLYLIGAAGLYGLQVWNKKMPDFPYLVWLLPLIFLIFVAVGLFIFHKKTQYTYIPRPKSIKFVNTKTPSPKQTKTKEATETVSIDGKRKCPHCGRTIPITNNKCPFCRKPIVLFKMGNGIMPIKDSHQLIFSKYHYEPEDETRKNIVVVIWTIIGTIAIIYFYMSIIDSCN